MLEKIIGSEWKKLGKRNQKLINEVARDVELQKIKSHLLSGRSDGEIVLYRSLYSDDYTPDPTESAVVTFPEGYTLHIGGYAYRDQLGWGIAGRGSLQKIDVFRWGPVAVTRQGFIAPITHNSRPFIGYVFCPSRFAIDWDREIFDDKHLLKFNGYSQYEKKYIPINTDSATSCAKALSMLTDDTRIATELPTRAQYYVYRSWANMLRNGMDKPDVLRPLLKLAKVGDITKLQADAEYGVKFVDRISLEKLMQTCIVAGYHPIAKRWDTGSLIHVYYKYDKIGVPLCRGEEWRIMEVGQDITQEVFRNLDAIWREGWRIRWGSELSPEAFPHDVDAVQHTVAHDEACKICEDVRKSIWA